MNCIICDTPLTGKQIKYCSVKCKNQDTNHKFQDYQCQRKRAFERKILFVNEKGGKCQECGYSKNLAALEFHHINSAEKRFKLDGRRFSNCNMDDLRKEAEKCVLLCSRCHREAHHPELNEW